MATNEKKSWTTIGAVIAAIAASACCVGPFVLLSLGIGGAWVSTLTSLEAVRPVFIVLTLVFIGLGYRNLYLVPRNCEEEACELPDVKKNQRIIFWIVSAFIALLLAFPWYAPYFME